MEIHEEALLSISEVATGHRLMADALTASLHEREDTARVYKELK